MPMRRFTRPTNAFSKKVENYTHSFALHFMHYNFCRQHKSLNKLTPAMAAGVTDRLWDIEDMVALIDAAEPAPKKHGPTKRMKEQMQFDNLTVYLTWASIIVGFSSAVTWLRSANVEEKRETHDRRARYFWKGLMSSPQVANRTAGTPTLPV